MGTLDWTSRAASIGTVRHVADGELIHDPEFQMDDFDDDIATSIYVKALNHVIFLKVSNS